MKNLLTKLLNDQKKFECQWDGIPNECEILQLDFRLNQAFVRFTTPIKKLVSVECEPEEYFIVDQSDDIPYKQIEIDSYEEWISLKPLK